MKKVFVPQAIASKELLGVIREVEAAGYDNHQAFISADFQEFAKPLQSGDTAVVYSLTAFASVTEILATFEQLNARGIELRSIQEPWFNDQNLTPKELLVKLFQFSEKLHIPAEPPAKRRSSRKSLRKKATPLKITERVALATQLVAQKMTISEACRLAGCSVSAYYAHKAHK